MSGPALALTARHVLLDIEGTISPTAFVKDVLFAYSRDHMDRYLAEHAADPEVIAILEEARSLAGGDPVAALKEWQAADVKAAPLKALQGLIWEGGFVSGAFTSALFPDALSALRRWRAAGLPLSIYSSGSLQAQALFFRHNEAGDLSDHFTARFDTTSGPKVEARSYTRIAESLGEAPGSLVFFSDNSAELVAARDAGLQVAHVVKEAAPDARFPSVSDFSHVEIALEATPA